MYTFACDSVYFVVSTQKNNQNDEIPITFMSYAFEGEYLSSNMTLRQNHPKLLEEKVFVRYLLILLMHMMMIYIQMMKLF